MKKYLYIFKSELMTNLQYIFDILGGFITYIIMITIFLYLWSYIYQDPNELINGYSMSQMIWYVIVTEIVWMSLGGRGLSKNICHDVRSGNITYNIIKPYHYVEYILFNHLGTYVIRFLCLGILGIVLGCLFIGSFPPLNILSILGVLLSCLLAAVISIFHIIIVGLISFFIEDAHPFYWLYSKFILVLGTIFPIEFFPKIIQPIIHYSPVFAVSTAPAKLFVSFTISGFIETIIIQLIHLIIAIIIAHLMYKKGVRKINVNGG